MVINCVIFDVGKKKPNPLVIDPSKPGTYPTLKYFKVMIG